MASANVYETAHRRRKLDDPDRPPQKPIRSPRRSLRRAGWRVRTDAATHSYVIEKSENNRWQKVASFLVNIASCKE